MARGSVKPRPMADGTMRYRIKWESRGPDGTRRYHSATKRTKKEADAFLADQLSAVETGTFVVASKETVGEYLDRWLAAHVGVWADGTGYQRRSVVRRRIIPYLGGIPLVALDEAAVQAWLGKLLAAGYAPATVRETQHVLSCALRRAVHWRQLTRNPATGVSVPTPEPAVPQVWTAAEASAFLAGTSGERFAGLWRLGLDTGMRIGELLALAWSDVDLDRGVVSVRRTLTKDGDGRWVLGERAKTGSSRRAIAIGPATVAALRAVRAKQAARRLAAGAVWQDYNLVFDRGNGEWLDPDTPRKAFARAVKRLGLPALTPHGMRHTMATLLLAAGVHPRIVQERLGHKTVAMTLGRYSHVSMTMQEDAAALLEGLLGGGARPRRGHGAG